MNHKFPHCEIKDAELSLGISTIERKICGHVLTLKCFRCSMLLTDAGSETKCFRKNHGTLQVALNYSVTIFNFESSLNRVNY